jgi:dihydrofolate reductase
MRKVILFNLVTLDGFFEGPNREIGWHNVDEEFNEFTGDQLNTFDILLFGRVTYELLASYWPTPTAIRDDPIIAHLMNMIPKIVFSRTLEKADWNNTRLIKDHIGEEITKLKEQPGKDMAIFGSGNLASNLTNLGLIDEYRIIVNPVILGDGHPLFKGVNDRLNLKLLKTMAFRSGNVLLYYAPA